MLSQTGETTKALSDGDGPDVLGAARAASDAAPSPVIVVSSFTSRASRHAGGSYCRPEQALLDRRTHDAGAPSWRTGGLDVRAISSRRSRS